MRVIAGLAKGRRLEAPRGLDTRPMTGRAREGLFSSLGPAVADAAVLDLYAGSGSLGLEALSRGASDAMFVEQDPRALEALRRNIEVVGLGGAVVAADVGRYLANPPGPGGAGVGLAFVDPPYALPLPSVDEVLAHLVVHLGNGAVVVVHRRRGGDQPAAPEGLAQVDRRTYGDSELFRFAKEAS